MTTFTPFRSLPLFALLVATMGCATPNATRMAVEPAGLDLIYQNEQAVRVDVVPVTKTRGVRANDFSEALARSIHETGIFGDVVEEHAPYVLRVESINTSFNGINTLATMAPQWQLIDAERDRVVWSEHIRSEARLAMVESPIGATRINRIRESAAQKNITQGLEALTHLDLAAYEVKAPLFDQSAQEQINYVRTTLQATTSEKGKTWKGSLFFNFAAQENSMPLAAHLIEAGVDVNNVEPASGQAPLHVAAQQGHHDLVAQLVAAGANIESTSINGRTPLYYAADGGHEATWKLLLDAGATMEPDSNQVAFDAAQWHYAFAEYLAEQHDERSTNAYQIAAVYYDQAALEFEDTARVLRQKRLGKQVGNILRAAAAQTAASYLAQQQAERMANASALSGGSGRGYGYAEVSYSQADTSTLRSLEQEHKRLAEESKEAAALCRAAISIHP